MSKDKFECDFKGCKESPESLTCFTGHGTNKNKDREGWYCDYHFTKLESEGKPKE